MIISKKFVSILLSAEKKFVFIIFVLIIIGCSRQERSMYSLKQESLATGIQIDTIFNNVYFGMSEKELFDALKISSSQNYAFNVKELEKYKFNVSPNYFNDSLYLLKFYYHTPYKYQKDELQKSLTDIFSIKYGRPDTLFTDKRDKSTHHYTYWLRGNLSINVNVTTTIYGKSESFYGVWIEYKDLRRNTTDRDLVRGTDDFFNIWTSDYYNNIFIKKRREDIEDNI